MLCSQKALYLPTIKRIKMYAIVEIAGQQFKVVQDQKLFVHRLTDKEGSKVSFDKVFLLDDGKKSFHWRPGYHRSFCRSKSGQSP